MDYRNVGKISCIKGVFLLVIVYVIDLFLKKMVKYYKRPLNNMKKRGSNHEISKVREDRIISE